MSTKLNETFTITNPIFYPNWPLHIWHASTLIISDVISRYQALIEWKDIRHTAWVDENWQKLLNAANESWEDITTYLNNMFNNHISTLESLWISNTDFIRTTENRHSDVVQSVLSHSYNKWDIYKGTYEWLYCVWCEAYMKESDLEGWLCPNHKKVPEVINQENYFFKLSKYQTWIEEFYRSNPDFITPTEHSNEVLKFIESGLEDFSISREKSEVWIKLPFDESHVAYIWFDALFNYYTTSKKSTWWILWANEFIDESDKTFPPNVQVMGKDILRFHAIYWPAMLASKFDLWILWEDGILHYTEQDRWFLPWKILSTWMLQVEWEKISKSLGNAISPQEIINEFWRDLLVNYLIHSFSLWDDANYKKDDAINSYNVNLANNIWNLESRTLKMFQQGVTAWILSEHLTWEVTTNIRNILEEYQESYASYMQSYNLRKSLSITFDLASTLNGYLHENKPWELLKSDNSDDHSNFKQIIYDTIFSLNMISINLEPFFPDKMKVMRKRLWFSNNEIILQENKWWLFNRIKMK